MTREVVRVADFTVLPGARYRKDGDGSADEFFEDYIKQKLEDIIANNDVLEIDLDNTLGYASSFISQLAIRIRELFRDNRRSIKKHIIIKSDDDQNQKQRFWEEIEK